MTAIEDDRATRPPRVALYRDPRARSIFVQALFVLLLLWLGWELVANARSNLAAKGIVSGFGFLDNSAGFDVSQSLIPYGPTDSVRRLYLVGLLNTLLVAVLGIVLATILGFIIGMARLSQQLAGRPHRRRLCRIGPQPAAAVSAAVLVSRRARHAACGP